MVAQMHRVEHAARIAMGGDGFSSAPIKPVLPLFIVVRGFAFLGGLACATGVALSYII